MQWFQGTRKGGEDIKYFETVPLYESDVVVVKDYKIKKKITLHRFLRTSGIEIEDKRGLKGTVNNEKLQENIIHAKSRIFELSYCNSWDIFMTLTIDQQKYDRKDLNRYHRDLGQWIRNYNKKYGTNIKYLLIPEKHKDGSWHEHGLFMGLPDSHLTENKNGYLDWLPYREKFGFCSIDKIKNHEAVSKYITKYISKDLEDCVKAVNAHMYYCSKGLNRAVELKRGRLSANNIPQWDYENEWVKCKWVNNSQTINDYLE